MTLLLLLTGCPGGDKEDSSHSPDDSADDSGTPNDTCLDTDTGSGADSLGSAPVTFVGGPSGAAGNAVAMVDDVDGDGDDEVLVAGYYGNTVCGWLGPVAEGRHDFGEAAASCWSGEGSYDFAGYSIAAVGDIDGDGGGDALIGAIGHASAGLNTGKTYLLQGPWTPGTGALADSATSWLGEASGDFSGVGLGRGGDLTGDGVVDLLIGASGNDAGGAGGGRAYLVAGPTVPGEHLLAESYAIIEGLPLPSKAANLPLFHGSYGGGDAVGDSLAGLGDVDGDGADDLLVGAAGDATLGPATGKAALFFGPLDPGVGSIEDAALLWRGSASESYVGSPVAAAGDIDGDGLADYLIAADGLGGGTVFLVFGSGRTGQPYIDEADASWVGLLTDDQVGFGMAMAGDHDGDGVLDLVLGAPGRDVGADVQECGAAYLIAGPLEPGVHSVGDATRSWLGEAVADEAGRSVAGGGDSDGNGRDDLLIGAIYNDQGGSFSGKAYLYPGE